MENEENRDLIHKKAYEDQFMAFVSSSLELSHYSLSLTLGHLEFSWSTLVWSKEKKESKGKEKKTRIKEKKEGFK